MWFAEVVCVAFEVFFPPGVMEGCLVDWAVGPASGVVQLGTEHMCWLGEACLGLRMGHQARAEATGESLALPELGSPPQTPSP